MKSQTITAPAAAPTVRLFTGDAEIPQSPNPEIPSPHPSHGLSPGMTLVDFYHAYVAPICLRAVGAAEGTLWQYGASMRLWILYTGDPPLERIDAWTCAEFLEGMSKRPGMGGQPISPNTVRKNCVHLQRVLDLAGPRSRENQLGQGLLDAPPWLQRPPKRDKPPEDAFTAEEVEQWLAACRFARSPKIPGVTPQAFWDALIRWIYNVGTRIETTLAITWPMIAPDADTGHWLRVPAAVMKGRRKGREFFVNDAAFDAADSIRTADARLFPWPHWMSHLHKIRRGILAKSEISEHRRFGFHGLRKTLATDMVAHSSIAAQMQMGHASMRTTRDHYTGRRAVREVLSDRPQPRATSTGPEQLRLF